MGEQLKTIRFAVIICLVCSVLLAFVSSLLTPRQNRNKENDISVRVLDVLGEKVTNERGKLLVSQSELDELFNTKITGLVLNEAGEVLPDMNVADLTDEQISQRNEKTGRKAYYPLYRYTHADGKTIYAMHISGKGLWSTIKGYLAVENKPPINGKAQQDIVGITFYEQEETPGLGGEIVKPFFTSRFIGKRLFDGVEQQLRILKSGEAGVGPSALDGITGATITCRGVQDFINQDYQVYNNYFEQRRQASRKGTNP